MSQGRPPRLSPDISTLSALIGAREMLPHGMKGRRGGAEDERKRKGTQKTSETHVGPQTHFFDAKDELLVAQHDTEGRRFASALEAARVAKNAKPTPSTEIKIGYQGNQSVRGDKDRASSRRREGPATQHNEAPFESS